MTLVRSMKNVLQHVVPKLMFSVSNTAALKGLFFILFRQNDDSLEHTEWKVMTFDIFSVWDEHFKPTGSEALILQRYILGGASL